MQTLNIKGFMRGEKKQKLVPPDDAVNKSPAFMGAPDWKTSLWAEEKSSVKFIGAAAMRDGSSILKAPDGPNRNLIDMKSL